MAKADRQRVGLTVLDQVIAEFAEYEFLRLSRGEKDVAGHVDNALQSLQRLQFGETPDYHDDWVALFYLTWYHPRQINLVYSYLYRSIAVLPERLQVVDLGCGAGAVQFALAIFAATREQSPASISVHGIDTSWPMRTIGLQLWIRFGAVIRTSNDAKALKNLDQVMAAMKRSCVHDSYARYVESRPAVGRIAADHTQWLTSVHAAYHLEEDVRDAFDFVSPDAILITSDDSGTRAVDRVLRTTRRGFRGVGPQEPRWRGCLPHTTKWRRQLLDRLKFPTTLTRGYLNNPVRWNPDKNPIEQDKIWTWGSGD